VIAGTRGSALALWQTHHVVGRMGEKASVEIIETRGDVDRTSRLQGKIEKGFFTAELEAALRESRVDFAVHSLKDLPTRLPEDLELAAVLERAAPNDRLLIRNEAMAAGKLPLIAGARVGATSLRREALLRLYGSLAVPTILRGNVPTRVKKLQAGEYDAILLAAAGLDRLALDIGELRALDLNPRIWIPAPGQGAIAVQVRRGDAKAKAAFASLHHVATARAVHLERELLRVFEGGCSSPFGAFAEGDVVYVGAEYDGRWKALKLAAPAAVDDRFCVDALDQLRKKGGDGEESWV
jgi:hydroxymethylbilane synthase